MRLGSRPLRWGKYNYRQGAETKEPRHFRKNHHQWLKEFGRAKVHDQIQRVVTIMKLCDDMNDFRQKFAKVFRKSTIEQMRFSWQD